VLVFGKIRAQLGGNLRIILSGGAAIPPEALEFYNTVGLELLQGYGLSETSGGVTTNRPLSFKHIEGLRNVVGTVGEPVRGVVLRIVPQEGSEDAEEGEIYIRGPLVFKGYWNMPAETAKTFDGDWFKTGDLGKIVNGTFLKITGRKKRQFKTDGGKYVSPEKIEKKFEAGNPIVQYIVPVGDNRKYIAGLIFVNQALAKNLINRPIPQGVDSAAYIAEQPEVVKAVEQAVADVNKALEHWETLKKVKIIPVEASVANGLLTPTLKIRSEEATKRFKDEVEKLYAK
jgi:long-chain acyl-CoA synthetase